MKLQNKIPTIQIAGDSEPLHWCLLADICNHTWIPECGAEDDIPANRKLFIDECDMYEYNCDYERDYEPINYSDCFNIPATGCPPVKPCPEIPPCPDHRLQKKGDKYKFIRTTPRDSLRRHRRTTTEISLPKHMLRGRRRYTPWLARTRKPADPCLLAQICNHTGIPVCGKHKETEQRKFLDECDMFEYNCDYHKEFSQINIEECDETTSITTTSTAPSSSTGTTTSSPYTTTAASTTSTTTPSTTFTTTEKTTSTTSTTTETTTPSTTSTTVETTTTRRTSSPIESTTITTEEPSTKSAVSELTIKYTCTSGIATISTSPLPITSLTDVTRPHPPSTSITTPSTTTVLTTVQSTTTTAPATLVTCSTYPKDCDRPVTWETTSKGETRDFYQILRDRCGDRVKLLRATTHWPIPAVVYRYNEENFRFGRHNEG
ncbi:unnamed protein product [Leptosia nina]|uniref:Uncharacterized protein n=1 Tax=Leptosia nina TaxID=320188 RepID=A0AAV1JBR0_9NEOP